MSLTTVQVATRPPYPVVVGPGALAALPAQLDPERGVAVLWDAAVAALYERRLAALSDHPSLAIEGGEGAKTLARLGDVLEFLAGARLSRRSTVVTVGGGTIADLGGLAASLFKRGCAVVHAPTTLLAQVDASVGGKTAINLAAGKNLAGTFHQPRAVFADTEVLATLPDDELASGLGEVVKTALLGRADELAELEDASDLLLARDGAALARVVRACVATKAAIVAEDPEERGARRALNLGHTFGHAIEHAAGYGVVPHGVAVAVGLALACEASRRTGMLDDADLPGRVDALLARLGLPGTLSALRHGTGAALATDDLLRGLAHDKKGAVGAPEFVLPLRPGEVRAGVRLDAGTLSDLLR